MRTSILSFALTATAAVASCSCSELFRDEEQGSIEINFERTSFNSTKSSSDIPDEEDFIIRVTDSEENEVYSGKYGSSPEVIKVKAGSYTVSAMSREFDEPLFDAPQFGDTQVVTVLSGQNVAVDLNCKQLNCGIKLTLDACFRTAFPEGVLYLNGSSGTLMYGYSESRTAFFKPGGVTLTLYNDGGEQTLCTRTLEAQQMLSLTLSANVDDSPASRGITLQLDTARNWVSESLVVGGDNAENSANAYNVSQARMHIGETGVWVYGYAVGVATNTNKFTFTQPFSKNTNIVLGLRSTSTESEYLMTVELPKGDIRDALNLQYNPEHLGSKIYLKGDITDAYYGIPGLKDVSAFEIQ